MHNLEKLFNYAVVKEWIGTEADRESAVTSVENIPDTSFSLICTAAVKGLTDEELSEWAKFLTKGVVRSGFNTMSFDKLREELGLALNALMQSNSDFINNFEVILSRMQIQGHESYEEGAHMRTISPQKREQNPKVPNKPALV